MGSYVANFFNKRKVTPKRSQSKESTLRNIMRSQDGIGKE